MLDVDRLRSDTPGTASACHFNAAGSALMAQTTIEVMKRHLDLEARVGGYRAADVRQDDIEAVYASMAVLTGCRPDNVALVENATAGFALALSAIDWKTGDCIVTTDNDYSSNQIAYLRLQERFGVEFVRAPESDEGGFEPAATAQLIEERQPRLVAISHIPTSSGLIQPVEALAEACRSAGALYLVDGCQSLGQLDIDFAALGCDIFTASTRKFLRGPRGVGIMLIADRLLATDFAPLYVDMRGATWTGPDSYELRADARRFENWEFNVAALLGAGAAAEYALSIGQAQIADYLVHTAQDIRKAVDHHNGWRVMDRGRRLGAIVSLYKPGLTPEQVSDHLLTQRIHHSITLRSSAQIDYGNKGIGWALRISPHVYNNQADLQALLTALDTL